MKYSGVINGLLSYFRDTSFWQMSQYSNELKSYRQNIAGQWDDKASSDINSQYLAPHEEDTAGMHHWFEQQHNATQQLTLKFDEVETVNSQIIELGRDIQKLLSDCEEDLRRAITNFDFASNRKSDADTQIPNISGLIRTANSGEFNAGY